MFAEELFTSLIGRQYPIDAAVSRPARRCSPRSTKSSGPPRCSSSALPDGQLFDFAGTPAAEVPPPKLFTRAPRPGRTGPRRPRGPPQTAPDRDHRGRRRGRGRGRHRRGHRPVAERTPIGGITVHRGHRELLGRSGAGTNERSQPDRVRHDRDGTHYGYLTDQGDGSFSFDRVEVGRRRHLGEHQPQHSHHSVREKRRVGERRTSHGRGRGPARRRRLPDVGVRELQRLAAADAAGPPSAHLGAGHCPGNPSTVGRSGRRRPTSPAGRGRCTPG